MRADDVASTICQALPQSPCSRVFENKHSNRDWSMTSDSPSE